MYSYVQKTLGEGEDIIHRIHFHWLYTLVAILSLVCLGWVIIGIFIFFYMMINKWTTERVLTQFRLIKKTGWIVRKTEEIQIKKMEEINLDQSILQRLLDSGNITISGMGTGMIEMKWIDEPLVFQKRLNDLKVKSSLYDVNKI
jgi:uncharacterized membrane protein YdbT with pleckstrin-like domain